MRLRSRPRPRLRLTHALAAAAALLGGAPVSAQPSLPERAPPRLPLAAPPQSAGALASDRQSREGREGPIRLEADRLEGQAERDTVASGSVVLRRGDLQVRAERLRLDQTAQRVQATGGVEVERGGDRFAGSELELSFDGDRGFLLLPRYHFAATDAGGQALRLDLLGDQRLSATAATYTSCPADGSGDPDWILSTRSVRMDFAANEGVAEGAVLRFMGVPILALPVLSFPLTSDRKTGWLPPSVNLDTRSGFELAVPWYWNLSPSVDATFTPRVMTRRGVGLDTELRYLDTDRRGALTLDLVTRDALTGTARQAFGGHHDGRLDAHTDYAARWLRVSDDDYWKDFARGVTSLEPRLLPADFSLVRRLPAGAEAYARLLRWQVLQDSDPASRIEAPYQRSPQLGLRYASPEGTPWQVSVQTEFNRFTLPSGAADTARPDGDRLHALAELAWPWSTAGIRFTPRLSVNAAAYQLQRRALAPPPGEALADTASRVIPSLSLDAQATFERDTQLFGRAVRQTLEPRMLYVRTPYRDPSRLPNFDSAARDFNFESLFADNAFSGVDRVSDADQLTVGATTRVFDGFSGGELLRLGIAQRLLFRDQRVTPDGAPLSQRFSDVLLQGSTVLVPRWTLDSGVQYSPEIGTAVRTLVGARFSPGPFRTVSAGYRFTRGATEQLELGWQWPLAGAHRDALFRSRPSAAAEARGCVQTWYGVGRLNYSMRDRVLTDSLVGFEVDSGCWIGRFFAERLSTGRSEATTRLVLQLELVGLSRLGANPLQSLKDNVPGYQLLRSREAVGAVEGFDGPPAGGAAPRP